MRFWGFDVSVCDWGFPSPKECSTIDMIADTLTKPLPLKAFVMLNDLILSGVPSPSDGLDKGE